MKKIVVLVLLFINIIHSQNYFETGNIGVRSDNFGGISVYSPLMLTRQIDRISILVTRDSLNVFDYMGDAATVTLPHTVSPPEYGDYQISLSIDNSYSGNPPSVRVDISAFGWQHSSYILVRFKITSRESESFNSYLGLEVLPIINNSFGFERVSLDHPNSIISIFKKKYVGMRFLSDRIYSNEILEWTPGYSKDKDFYKWMSSHQFKTEYTAGKDGSVIVTSIENGTLQPNMSDSLWIAIATADTLLDLYKSIDSASQRIPHIVTKAPESEIAVNEYNLMQNYPNPFNPVTRINFQIKEATRVSLIVYDILGREVAELVNGEYSRGNYSIDFNGTSVANGVYIYRLIAGEFVMSKKMILIK
ncbi:MAG: T9SS type A sorting domain-containing protein [Ignavibacteriaceae bacterium]